MFTKYFEKVVCLSLESRKDRRSAFDKQAKELGFDFEYIDAIPGEKYKSISITDPFRQKHNHNSFAHNINVGTLLEECLRNGTQSVLFFEDDCLLSKDIFTQLDTVELPEKWDLFYLGAWHTQPPITVNGHLYKAVHAQMSHAVAIHARVMPLLIHECISKNEQLFDMILARRINPLGLSYCIYPDMAIQADGFSNMWQKPITHKHRWKNENTFSNSVGR
jgi:hypothetical protein